MPSSYSGWSYRVDAENPAIKQQRHVHVAQTKHTGSKSMQVAWNVDGSRHDKKSFNSKIGAKGTVRQIARDVLHLPANVILEDISEQPREAALLRESVEATSEDITHAAVVAARDKNAPWSRLMEFE